VIEKKSEKQKAKLFLPEKIVRRTFIIMETYGKIFVVVTVLAVILVGIFVYLFFIDRKIGKLEKEIQEKENQIKQ